MNTGQNFREKDAEKWEKLTNTKSIHFDVHNKHAGSQILTQFW